MIKYSVKSKMLGLRRAAGTIILIFSSFINVSGRNVFDELKPMAFEGLKLSVSDNQDDKVKALPMLVEFVVRGQDWLNTDSEEDIELMANAVATVMHLKNELQDTDSNELLKLMFNSAITSVTANDYTFENIYNIFPIVDSPSECLSNTSYENIEKAVAAMRAFDMKQSERILLDLYGNTWLVGNEPELRYSVANKLILFYLRLGLYEHAIRLLRQNKMEMDKNFILDEDYLECLFYFGMYYIYTGNKTLSRCYLETADEILKRIGCDVRKTFEDFNSVMSSSDAYNHGVYNLYSFLSENDAVFWFLTERERVERWNTFLEYWRTVKSDILRNFDHSSDINDLLNAFQYEKYLLLRSYSKIASIIYNSDDTEAISLLNQLNQIRMKMTDTFGSDWDNLNAEYQRIQKELMHHPVINSQNGKLYHVISSKEIAACLSDDETYIDFGVINDNGEDNYYALLINKDLPQGKLIKLCESRRLHSFIENTTSTSAFEMVRSRYEDDKESLFNMLWKPLQESGLLKTNILYCPAEDINLIMPEAIMNAGKYLAENYNFHILTSYEAINDMKNSQLSPGLRMVAFNDIDYIGDRQDLIRDARQYGAERALKSNIFDDDKYGSNSAFSKINSLTPLVLDGESEWLADLMTKYEIQLKSFNKVNASEYAFKDLSSKGIDVIHVSTHAFCIPRNINAKDYPYIRKQQLNFNNCESMTGNLLPMFRSGLLLSGAERHWCGRNCIDGIEDGILNAEEMSALNLHNVKIISLIACSTGNGDIDEYEGIMGLRRALKMAGCKSLILTAWDIDSEAALTYVSTLYDNIFKGINISDSHIRALHKLMERYESPYFWAPFQLIF